MSKLSIMTEFWEFLRVRKKFWLLPFVVTLLLFGLLLIFGQNSAIGQAVSPFIYALF